MRREKNIGEQKRKTEIKGYFFAAIWGILLGVAVVFASMAMRVAAAPKTEKETAQKIMEETKGEKRLIKTEVKTVAKKAKKAVKAAEEKTKREAQAKAAEAKAIAEQAKKAEEEQKIMYLTFDDGPSAQNTDKVLDVLKEKNVKATFFVIGEYVRKNPETAKRIAAEGHTIGIHCDVHDYGPLYKSVDSYIEDFQKAYDTVLEVTGVEAKLFRFPGGSVNAYNKGVRQDIIDEMEKRGFIYYDWNASLEDASGKGKTKEQLIQSAIDTSLGRKKVVLLAHDRVENTALALGELIDTFSDYKMEPLTEDVEPVQF